VELNDGIWTETANAAFTPVLRKPNRFQNHIQFKESWVASKLMRGNTYILKARDARNVVVALYPLDPCRVTPLVAPDGEVFYQLSEDNLAGIGAAQVVVPASEIIHDRMNCLFHPLVGLSPLYAAAATAEQGLKIQRNSSQFFANNSSPGGMLIAPGEISPANAQALKEAWQQNYSGANAGRVAVLGNNLKFEPMRMSAVESQLIEQLNISAKVICSAFHVPPFMIGMGEEPTYSNGETRTSHYYSQCLQSHIEHMEEAFDDALGLLGAPKSGLILGVELDLSGLMRMDTKTQIEALSEAVKGSIMTPNEARRPLNLPKVKGGDTIFMQQQNFSLEALSQRPAPDVTAPAPAEPAAPAVDPVEDAVKAVVSQAQEIIDRQAAESASALSKQAETIDQLRAAVRDLLAERQAVATESAALDQKQRALEVSQDMAQALMRKFTGASHAS
jgi:HK97 family phage portal protein